jgi:hypothetical protein
MAFATGDRQRLVTCLNLTKDQLKDGSILATLMADLAAFDAAHGATLVTGVLDALGAWEDATAALPALQQQDGYNVIDIDNEVRISTHSPGAFSAATQGQRRGYINTILKYLDEHDQLQPFILTGRVIQTL